MAPAMEGFHCHHLEHEHEMMVNFMVDPADMPKLQVEHHGATVVCRWAAQSGGWILESSSDLVDWQREMDPPAIVDGMLEWRGEISAARRFFRLGLL